MNINMKSETMFPCYKCKCVCILLGIGIFVFLVTFNGSSFQIRRISDSSKFRWKEDQENSFEKQRTNSHRKNFPLTHIFTAIARINSSAEKCNSILLNVWHEDFKTKLKCCFRYQNGVKLEAKASLFHFKYSHAKIYECQLPEIKDLPKTVSLLRLNNGLTCSNATRHISVVYPKRSPEKLALCVKAAYGTLNPRELIAWIEFHLMMGVDKYFFLVDSIDDHSYNVLDYYSGEDIVDIINFTFPGFVKAKNKFRGNYQRLSTFDCQERLRGYTYAGLLDIDEYLVPKVHKNVKDLIQYYLKKNNRTAGITFKAEYFFKDWKQSKPDGKLDALYYFERSTSTLVRVKSIHIPTRTIINSVDLHEYKAREGYRRVFVRPDMGTIHHYRDCPMDKRFGDCSKSIRYNDEQMLEFRGQLLARVDRTWKEIKRKENLGIRAGEK